MNMKEPACTELAAQPNDPFRQRVERLLVELHNEERLSEGQCAKVLGVDRITWRKIADEAALEDPAAVRPHDRAAFDADGTGLPVMPPNISHVLQRIRRNENDIAAQLVLENFAREYARYALQAAAKSDERVALLSEQHIRDIAAVWVKDPHHFEFEARDFIECAYALVRAAAQQAGAAHIKALIYLDRELSEYLEGMPADETSRKLRDVARAALSGINPLSVANAMGAPSAKLVERLFNKHGGPVQDEGWCLNESGLNDFLRELFSAPMQAPIDARLTDELYVLSMNEEAMEEAIQQFEGSSAGESLKCVLHAQKQLRAILIPFLPPSDAAHALERDVRHHMNNALCEFALRWRVESDYVRCAKCKRAHIASKADMDFEHAAGCKNAGNAEAQPWRTLLSILSPLYIVRGMEPKALTDTELDELALEAFLLHNDRTGARTNVCEQNLRWYARAAITRACLTVPRTRDASAVPEWREIPADEHPAARKWREEAEAKYGDMVGIRNAVNVYLNVVKRWDRPYNSQLSDAVTRTDLETAETEMLAKIREEAAWLAGRPELAITPTFPADHSETLRQASAASPKTSTP